MVDNGNQASLTGKVIILTGASMGIGLGTASALARRGARLAMVARNTDKLKSAAARLPGEVRCYPADVSEWHQMPALVDWIASDFGGIDGLINNAAVSVKARIERLDPDLVMRQVATNILAPIFLTKSVIPHIRARGEGHIIFISSESVRRYGEGYLLSIYAATKAGMERFAEELREEVKQDNISVTTFSPGATKTSFGRTTDSEVLLAEEMWTNASANYDGLMDPDWVGEAIARCLELPSGAAFDFVAMRPNRPMPRIMPDRVDKV